MSTGLYSYSDPTTIFYNRVVILPGAGEFPRKGDFVTVHCSGYGKSRDLACKFWSTHDEEEDGPFKFQLGGGDVIEGWEVVLFLFFVFFLN